MNMAKKRPNIIPIIEDARHPQKYRMLVPMVDVVFAGDPCVLALAREWRKARLPAAAQPAHAFSTVCLPPVHAMALDSSMSDKVVSTADRSV